MSFADLNAQVKSDLDMLVYDAATWVRPHSHLDGHVYDVVIVGGGQCGLGAAFGLLRERITNILVIDENPAGGEGPWETYVRMITLRSSNHLTGIDFGVPSLTFRAFWEARHGAEAWAALDNIPREEWMSYLRWFSEVLDLPVALARYLRTAARFRQSVARRPSLSRRRFRLSRSQSCGGTYRRRDIPLQLFGPDQFRRLSLGAQWAETGPAEASQGRGGRPVPQ